MSTAIWYNVGISAIYIKIIAIYFKRSIEMSKKRALITIISLAMVIAVTLALGLSAGAASYVTDSDWMPSGLDLSKCEGEGCDHTECDYVYSFAFVGDTQSINYRDVTEGNKNMAALYSWIVANKEKYNIEYVMGLGDITESFNSNYETYDEEWANAKESIALLDGVIDYSLVLGNHDNTSGFNGTFGVGNRYYEDLKSLSGKTDSNGRAMAGFFDESKIEDTYRKIEIGDHKYIIFTLRRYAAESSTVLQWIDDVLSANSDYSAIVTLHQFMYKDSTILDPLDKDDLTQPPYERTLWDDCLSKHKNVSMIISGHIEVDDIYKTQLRGENGNTVTCMLIDGQEIDMRIENAGMVAMFYVSKDGSVVNVEYISTIRDLKGDSEKYPAYLKDINQFTVDVDYSDANGDGWTETSYGYIPTEIYESKTFHVLLDDDGIADNDNFLFGSYDTWEEVLSAIHACNGKLYLPLREAKTYYVVMAEDYTDTHNKVHQNEAGKNPGAVVFDLNGNTLTVSRGTLLPYYNNNASLSPEYTIKNGNIDITGDAKIAVTQSTASGVGGTVTLNLEDLDITYKPESSTASVSPIISYYTGTGDGAYVNVHVTNCNIDSSGVGTAVTYFSLLDPSNNNHVDLTIKGGSFKGSTVANTTVFSGYAINDKVTVVKDANGNYPTLTLDDNGVVSGVYCSDVEGTYLSYGLGVLTDGKYVYTLAKASIEITDYGILDTEKYPVNDHPFVVFKDGNVIHTFSDWKAFIDTDVAGKVAYRSGCTVLLRKDYCMNDASGKVTGLYRISDLTLDLGGNTITTGEKYLFQAIGRNDQGYEKTFIKVTNGTLKGITKYAPIVFNDSSNSTGVENFDFLLEDLTLDVSAGIGIARCYGDGTVGADNSITIKNCTIYRDSVNQSVNLFMMSDTKNILDINVNITDTSLVASSLTSLTLANYNNERESGKGSPDTLTLGEGFTVTLPASFDVSSYKYSVTNGTFCLAKTSVNEDGTVNYELYDVRDLVTPYGDIDVKYASVIDHPFVVFKDGKVIYTFSDWYKFLHTDISKSANSALWSGCTVYMRADYNTTNASGKASRMYYISDMTFDLGGHTLTAGDKHLFQAIGMSTTEKETTYVKIINGTLAGVSGGYAPIVFNDSTTSTVVEKFDFVLENVTVDVSSGIGLIKCYNNGTIGAKNTVTLNNCTIYRDSKNASVTIFGLTDNNNILDIDVIVNGGKLEASSMSGIAIVKVNAKDTLRFGKNANGEYFTINIPKSEEASTGAYVTTSGVECVFVKATANDTTATYKLMPKVMVDYKIKTSVTLYSNFVYNIYIPTANVNGFTVNGMAMDYTTEVIDNVEYYVVKVDLAAGETLADIKLCITLNSGNTTVDANWTLNVYNYTKAVLGGDYNETTKTLMKDMLVYASAAHTYFENTEAVAEKLAEIKNLLGDYAAEMPTGEAKTPTDKSYFTDVAVYLGEVPAFRFYLASGYTAADFTFKVGNRTVEAKASDDGKYVEIVMYAYMMLDDVTFTVKSTGETGTYNLYSYYEYATEQNNANLVAVVEALMKYSVSAKNYRNSVVGM